MGQLLATLLVVAATATPSGTTPREVVQAAVTRVVAVVQDARVKSTLRPARAEQARAEVRRVAGELFDFDEMARRSLPRHWAARTSEERAEFVRLFTDLLERTYLGRIQSYAGEKIVYLGEGVDGSYATVKSKVVTPRRAETGLDYRLHLKDGRWRVYDVLIDGVSFVSTYRSEFDRVIQAGSYSTLIERLRGKASFPPVTAVRRSPS
jgi:phospholipid transport system substrate-binding protein